MNEEIKSWADFVQNRPTFVQTFAKTLSDFHALLLDTNPLEGDGTGSLLWRFIFASHVDCDDILTLVSNNRHWGALKILRSFFERTLTAKYLIQHPSETQNFYDFDALDYKGAMDAIKLETGLEMSTVSRANLDDAAIEARSKFKLEPCETCGKGGRMSSWTPRSVLELSRLMDLNYMYFSAWVLPTKLVHPTFYGLERVIHKTPPIYNTLFNVHSLLVENILMHQRHFISPSEPTILMTETVRDFFTVWTISATDFGLPLTRF